MRCKNCNRELTSLIRKNKEYCEYCNPYSISFKSQQLNYLSFIKNNSKKTVANILNEKA